MIKIKVRNLGEVSNAISSMPLGLRGEAADAASDYLLGNEQRGLRHYPAQRPGQKYIRTYNLRSGWQKDGKGVQIALHNSVEYAPYVQGDDTQAWMHAGRWHTVTQIFQSNIDGMINAIYQRWQKWLKGKGLG